MKTIRQLAIGLSALSLLAACATTPSPAVLAGLRPTLTLEAERIPGSRVLEGRFSVVQQSVGTARPFSHIEIGGSM